MTPTFTLTRVDAVWTSPFDDGLWADVKQRGRSDGVQVLLADQDGEPLGEDARGFLVGPAIEPDPQNLICQVVVVHLPDDSLRWQVRLHQRPDGEAPDEVREYDRVIGASTGLRELLRRGQAACSAATVAEYSVHAHVEARVPLMSGSITKGGELGFAAALGAGVTPVGIGFHVSSGVQGIYQTSLFALDDEATALISLARGKLSIGDRSWLPYAVDVAEVSVGTMFGFGRATSVGVDDD